MALSRSLSAAVALATFASILFRPSLQSWAATSSDKKHPAPITPHNASSPAHSPAPAPSSGAPIPRASPPPHKNSTQQARASTGAKAPSHTAHSGESINFRRGKALGIALVATAGALQAAVVAFLFVKRKQMLKMVRSYDTNGPSETWNDVP